jgi:serine/threonine protein kinase
MLQDIVEKPIIMKDYFSPEVKSLLSGLLERNPNKRLGCSSADASDIMSHPFFRDINWIDLREKRI